MAILIPETLAHADQAELDSFSWLRKSLPDECCIWHHSGLELTEDEKPTFLGMAEYGGLFMIHVRALPVGDNTNETTALQDTLQEIHARHAAFLDLLRDTEEQDVVLPNGKLRPAIHCVCLLANRTARDISQQGLRPLAQNVVLLGKDEVSQLFAILQSATPSEGRLTPKQFNIVRLMVSPSLEIRMRRRATTTVSGSTEAVQQPLLLDVQQEQVVKSFLDLPDEQHGLSRDLDTRLVRGVPGSGKSVILLHRAHLLAQRFPNWNILVVTYNRSLAEFLAAKYRDFQACSPKVFVTNFHRWAYSQLHRANLWVEPYKKDRDRDSIMNASLTKSENAGLGVDSDYLRREVDWITDTGIASVDGYLQADRRGRKQRLTATQRRIVWRIRDEYIARSRQEGKTDWSLVAATLLDALNDGRVAGQQFDAILVDEAQDYAPIWFTILLKMLRPATNMLFMVADTAQKLYERPLSWKALGIDLKGNRSRVLKKSYRNTYQILQAASEVILGNSDVAQELKAEGDELIQADLNKLSMRPGPVPVLWWTKDQSAQINAVTSEIISLRQKCGYAWDDFAIFAKTNQELYAIERQCNMSGIPCTVQRGQDIDLSSDDVKIATLYAGKGLEFTNVFIIDVDQLKPAAWKRADEEITEALAAERRLLYVGMTRARDRLHLMYSGVLPEWLQQSLKSIDRRA